MKRSHLPLPSLSLSYIGSLLLWLKSCTKAIRVAYKVLLVFAKLMGLQFLKDETEIRVAVTLSPALIIYLFRLSH